MKKDFLENDVQIIIEKYQLKPHPEGGYYREIYRSEQLVYSDAASEKRNTLTHIYFLLKNGEVSRFHKVVHDEIWNFYEGAPLMLVDYNGDQLNETFIGQGKDSYTAIIPGGNYQAAETLGEYTLVGCTVAPGFDFKDFSFLKDDQEACERLKKLYPLHDRFV